MLGGARVSPPHPLIPGTPGREASPPGEATSVPSTASRHHTQLGPAFISLPGMPSPGSRKSPAKVPSTAPMEAEGSSVRWAASLKNQERIFDLFLQHVSQADARLSTEWGAEWRQVEEQHACAHKIWAHFATYLAETYESESGKKLGLNTAPAIWGGMLQQTKNQGQTEQSPHPR